MAIYSHLNHKPQPEAKMGKKPSPANANSGNEDFHAAARSGDLKAVIEICSANPLAVNSRDRHSRTPLHLASWSGHAEVVDYLCKNKADVGAAAMDDMAAIHFAAQKGHLEVIKILVTAGVSVKSCNRKGMTAIHYAAQGSDVELVKYLLKKGANKNSKNKAGKSAVDLASSDEIRKLLVDFEFESDSSSGKGEKGAEKEVSDREEGEVYEGNENGEEGKDENLKRKSEGDEIKENRVGIKKSKVALSHLVATDDTLEEDED